MRKALRLASACLFAAFTLPGVPVIFASAFRTSSCWHASDAGNSGGLTNTKGYRGAVFDGRYVYFSPGHDGTSPHGKVLRYDTTASITDLGAWQAFDAGNSGGLSNTKGYDGAAFDGRYVYFSPDHDGASAHGKVLRYDTTVSFTNPGAWQAFDAGNSGGLSNTRGYRGAVFDGRYVYFSPGHDGASAHGKVLRYDTTVSFTNPGAWQATDAGNSGGLSNTKGYDGAVFDGSYVYFSPGHDGVSAHGKVLRYDTTVSFTNPGAWQATDAGNTAPLTDTKGYRGAVFDGRYVYFSPGDSVTPVHGKVLRYDTTVSFTNSGAWQAFDAGNTAPLTDTKGYGEAVFDGRYVYFSPGRDGTLADGKVLRYDTPAAVDTALRFEGQITIGWEVACGALSYNVYRGDVSGLIDNDQDGLPDGDYGVCVNHLDEDTTDTVFVDQDLPLAGQGFFYLMSFDDGSGEQGLGETSAGLRRQPLAPCQ